MTFDGYSRLVARVVGWIATAFIAGTCLILLCILVDWTTSVGWGYPWYALPLALVMIAAGVMTRRFAVFWIRQISN